MTDYYNIFNTNQIKSKPQFKTRIEMPKQLKVNIVLEKQGQKYPISIEQTLRPNSQNQLLLNEIILILKRKNFNKDIEDSSVSYYHYQKKLFIFGFFISKHIRDQDLQEPFTHYTKRIPFEALESVNGQFNCKLRLRKKIKTKVQSLVQEQEDKFGQSHLDHDHHKASSKQKEKTIAEVIQKVALWRKLYTGFQSQTGASIHKQLDDAAKHIGVIKKTLDDYLLQIRNGKRHGYNFHKNRDNKIGDLRSFVRDKKSSVKEK